VVDLWQGVAAGEWRCAPSCCARLCTLVGWLLKRETGKGMAVQCV
jgi:hypothetical protein